jgi:hypothetical protein
MPRHANTLAKERLQWPVILGPEPTPQLQAWVARLGMGARLHGVRARNVQGEKKGARPRLARAAPKGSRRRRLSRAYAYACGGAQVKRGETHAGQT